MSRDKTYSYKSLSDDFFEDGKEHRLPKDYRYIKTGFGFKIKSAVVYSLAVLFGAVYCRLFLHMRMKGAKKIRRYRGGFIVYANHTQPVGDVVIPALVCFPKRIYTVVSPANLDIPVIGKILHPLGALPLPSSLGGMKAFTEAFGKRVEKHPIIIYPEAHVWPYYTGIRPFSDGAFKYPDKYNVPAFVMTMTYQKRRYGKKPKSTVYVNGPFYSKGDTAKARAGSLHDSVYSQMKEFSKNSNYEYIKYKSEE